jgi:hypothetical protein
VSASIHCVSLSLSPPETHLLRSGPVVRHEVQTLAVAYWVFHYTKRIFETYFVHRCALPPAACMPRAALQNPVALRLRLHGHSCAKPGKRVSACGPQSHGWPHAACCACQRSQMSGCRPEGYRVACTPVRAHAKLTLLL